MCLDTRYPPDVEKKMIAKLPDEFTAYKVVVNGYGKYLPLFGRGEAYSVGENIAPKRVAMHYPAYMPYYHCLKTKKAALNYYQLGEKPVIVIKVRVPKNSITAIGEDCDDVVIVSRKIIMPDPKDKKAVVK